MPRPRPGRPPTAAFRPPIRASIAIQALLGELIEYGVTDDLFIKPKKKQTEDYITGRFG